MSALETQIGGSHYKSMPIQPMEFSMANELDACQHTIVKYVTRFRDKGGIQDLEKAKHVIDMLIEFETRGLKVQKAFAFPELDKAQNAKDPLPKDKMAYEDTLAGLRAHLAAAGFDVKILG